MYVIRLDSGVGIHLKSRRHRIAHSTQRGPALPTEGPAARGNMTMADTEKVASGIPGLDDLIEGGFWPKSTVVILGSSGTGKSTFAIQFLMEGIEQGEQALYVTLEEPPEQIMREADLMGFDMRKYYEKSLFFIHLKGRNFKKMIEEQLPQLVKARADYNIKTRVVIDPMTPVIWATAEKLEQRELIGKLFYTLKELGVVLCTVEEHAKPGETIGEDVLLPIYLSDGAIHLEYYPIGGAFNRTLKVLKMRGIHHGEGVYPYIFARGVGAVIRSAPVAASAAAERSHKKVFEEAYRTAAALKAPPTVLAKIRALRETSDYDSSPDQALSVQPYDAGTIIISGVGDKAFLVFLATKPLEIPAMEGLLANVLNVSAVMKHLLAERGMSDDEVRAYAPEVVQELKRLSRSLFV